MGVLNVTPDSFSDGGLHLGLDDARRRAAELIDQGADVIDVGGYSSRPGARDVPADEEAARVLPVVEAIAADLPGAVISIDTFRVAVAEGALDRGASIVNDITGGRDPALVEVAAARGAGYVAMHMQGTPRTMQDAPSYDDVVDEVSAFLAERVAAVRSAGVSRVWADPGFGFGKTLEHNYRMLGHLDRIAAGVGAPLLVGLSRKGMFWRDLDSTPQEVGPAMAAAHLVAIQKGAAMVRVHDVPDVRQVIRVAARLAQWAPAVDPHLGSDPKCGSG